MQRRDFLLYAAAAATMRPLISVYANDSDSFIGDPRVNSYISHLHKQHNFVPDELHSFFSTIKIDNSVLRLTGVVQAGQKPSQKVYWREYRRQRMTPKKIAAGAAFHRRHLTTLQRAETQYGIPATVITAIIGIETHYGEYTGKYTVGQTLATLGFRHPRRGSEFLDELTEFLLYARESGIDPLSISGSYAGAIGIAQFMPSSLRKYAVDADGDAHANLFKPDDAIPSIANFLREFGWRSDVGITYAARVADDAAAQRLIEQTSKNAYRAIMTHADLSEYGVKSAAPDRADARYVFVDLENRYDMEYRVGTENFYALTRYNKSFKYASVVTDLAAEIQRTIG